MRKWNAPELKVLTIEKTENGFFNSQNEFWFILNDSLKGDDNKSSTPETEDDVPNELS